MIDVLIPVLGRPESAQRVADSIHRGTRLPHHILFICSDGDEQQILACLATGDDVMVMSSPAGRHDYPLKMNAGYRDTSAEWILLGADDIAPERGWDEIAVQAAGDRYHVIATNDKANGQVQRGLFGTHCLVRRSYVDDQGASADPRPTLIHEGYDHNFCDRELCGVARHRGVYLAAKNSVIRHHHPNWRTARNDDTYEKGRASYKEDYALFLERAKLWGHDGLTGSEVSQAQHILARRRGRRR